MGAYDESEEGHSFMKDLIPNLSELESTIRDTLGFKPDCIEKITEWVLSGCETPLELVVYKEALPIIEKALEHIPPEEFTPFGKEVKMLLFALSCLAKDTDKAVSYYTILLQENPDDYELAFNCAEGFLVELRNYAIAKVAYQALVQMRPNDFEAHFNLGVALLMTGDSKGAKSQSIKCFKLAAGDELKREQWSALYRDSKKQLGERTEYGSSTEEQRHRIIDFLDDVREVD